MLKRLVSLVLISGLLIPTSTASAHQPYFEEADSTAASPWPVPDAQVSTAVYATLESADDVDYFHFEAVAGEVVLLEMTIPQIDGQAGFVPTLAVMGPGLDGDAADLPGQVSLPEASSGVYLLPPVEATVLREPFSGTSYWSRQSQRLTLTLSGTYSVAVWHAEGRVGRYVFVIGSREFPGGDPAFREKLTAYWTPVAPPAAVPGCVKDR